MSDYRPDIVFGEQVSGKAGREWFDGVSADLEAINYEVGAADLPACSVGRRTSGNVCGGWPTPNTPNGGRKPPPGTTTTGKTPDGKKRQVDLFHVAQSMTGWPTPRANDSTGPQECPNRTGGASLKQVAGWGTPRVAKNNGYGSIKRSCDGQARIEDQVTGIIINGLNVEMANKEKYRLNPLFSLWLMGYPEEWLPLEE